MSNPSCLKSEAINFASVVNVTLVSKSVYRVLLSFNQEINYYAGQYLKLWLNEQDYREFSIASTIKNTIELFISHATNNSITSQLVDCLTKNCKVKISIPYGKAFYRSNSKIKTIWIIVSDTSYAYGKSILLEALKSNNTDCIYFSWILSRVSAEFDNELVDIIRKNEKVKYFRITDINDVFKLLTNNSDLLSCQFYFGLTLKNSKKLFLFLKNKSISDNAIFSDSLEKIDFKKIISKSGIHMKRLMLIRFIQLKKLKPTEKHDHAKVNDLINNIQQKGFWTQPLLVESKTNIIMDGHHRLQAAKLMGLSKVPCLTLDYANPYLKLASRIKGKNFTSDEIIEAGVTGNLLDYKSTRHKLTLSLIQIKIPIDILKN